MKGYGILVGLGITSVIMISFLISTLFIYIENYKNVEKTSYEQCMETFEGTYLSEDEIVKICKYNEKLENGKN